MSTEETTQYPAPVGAIPVSAGAIIAVIVVSAAVAYSFHERTIAKQLQSQNEAISASLNATRGQIDALNSKLNLLAEAETSKHQPPAKHAAGHEGGGKPSAHIRRDDPRWKQLQGRIDEQGKQIEANQQDLANTRTELQGSIAHTHDELVMLQKKGERNYYEFDVDKNGQFQHNGPMGVRLRKANTKHEYADLELMVDDYKLSKKHVNIFEPVTFYNGDNARPVELVINSISKNHIHGYVSEPKYKTLELQAVSATAAHDVSNAGDRRRLEVPQN
ncbi:MAG TPA: hypothetical protein VFA89_19095 [Terriglobales bacterium]|nr:hypothetical protein [Terriglobales bacterium]